jgi:hypothetical protein
MDARTVAIDSKGLESGIEALSSAAQAFRLTRFETAAYYLLTVSVDVTVWSVVTLFVLAIVVEFLPVPEGTAYQIGQVSGAVLSYGTVLAAIALLINIPLAAKLYRKRARLKEVGLASLSKSLWRETRRGRRISQVLRWGPVIAFVISFSFAGVSAKLDQEWNIEDTMLVMLCTIFICLLVLAGYLRNQRERMDLTASAGKLKNALQGLQRRAGKAEIVSVPSELLEQAARIESAQIAKDRRDAVLQSVPVGPTGYGITFDHPAAEQRQMLNGSG